MAGMRAAGERREAEAPYRTTQKAGGQEDSTTLKEGEGQPKEGHTSLRVHEMVLTTTTGGLQDIEERPRGPPTSQAWPPRE